LKLVGGEAVAVELVVVINGEINTIEFVEAIFGGEPHIPVAIFDDAIDVVGGKAVVAAKVYKVKLVLLRTGK
jgi:hypothetical protein